MILGAKDRRRFITYLEWEAESIEDNVRELRKINGPVPLEKKYSAEALSCRVVAKMLREFEDDILGSEEE